MAGTVRHAKLQNRTSRRRLKRGRMGHWNTLTPGKAHLGYQCWETETAGRWLLRRYIGQGKYNVETLGRADDVDDSNGADVLSFKEADEKARVRINLPNGAKITGLTVRQAMANYVEYKKSLGQSVADVMSRGTAHILPALGDLAVSELTADVLRRWLARMASRPAQVRPKRGKIQYAAEPTDDEGVRRRRATANRVLSMLKAILNHAYDEEHVSHRDAWGRKLKPFKGVDTARVRYLNIAEAKRLINACDPDLRPLVRAALETGARYSELGRLEVVDFNSDAGTVAIRRSKSGKARYVVLTDEGSAFFKSHCAGRAGHELMFQHFNGTPWKTAEQARPVRMANARAKLTPQISFHGLRHTWASLSVMAGVPLIVVAKNLGHADTRMVEKHYGHLAPSYVAEAIRAGAPKFGIKPEKKVAALR